MYWEDNICRSAESTLLKLPDWELNPSVSPESSVLVSRWEISSPQEELEETVQSRVWEEVRLTEAKDLRTVKLVLIRMV